MSRDNSNGGGELIIAACFAFVAFIAILYYLAAITLYAGIGSIILGILLSLWEWGSNSYMPDYGHAGWCLIIGIALLCFAFFTGGLANVLDHSIFGQVAHPVVNAYSAAQDAQDTAVGALKDNAIQASGGNNSSAAPAINGAYTIYQIGGQIEDTQEKIDTAKSILPKGTG